MFVIVGFIVVIGSVLGGFLMEGGPVLVLMQWVEFLIIGGCALGSMMIANPTSVVKKIFGALGTAIKGPKQNEVSYTELLKLLYDVSNLTKKEGMLTLESHIEDPNKSTLFKKYKDFLANHHAVSLLTDSLRIVIMGGVPPFELEMMIDGGLELHHEEASAVPGAISKISDSLPGIGIVAAVLGIVITMQSVGGPPEVIGHKVAAALVGTFLGILLCYGFVGPVASNLMSIVERDSKYLQCIKAGVVGIAKNYPPMIVVEFARNQIISEHRPSFAKIENAIKATK